MHILDLITQNLSLHLALEEERIRLFRQQVDSLRESGANDRQLSPNGQPSEVSSNSDSGHIEDDRRSRSSDNPVVAFQRDSPVVGTNDLNNQQSHEMNRSLFRHQKIEIAGDLSGFRLTRSASQSFPHRFKNDSSPPRHTKQLSPKYRSCEFLFPSDEESRVRKKQQLDSYRQELDEQIREKRLRQEEELRRQKEEDEKWETRVEEQRRKLKREFEAEQQRVKSLTQPDLPQSPRASKQETSRKTIHSPSYVHLKSVIRRKQSLSMDIDVDGPSQSSSTVKEKEVCKQSPPKPTPRSSIREKLNSNRPFSALNEIRRMVMEDHHRMLLRHAVNKQKEHHH